MRVDRLSSSVVLAVLFVATGAHAQSAPIPKQLSGPPAEFASMRAPLPAESAIHSKSALLRVDLASDQGIWSARIPVENGNARFIVFSGQAGAWDVALEGANGAVEKAARRTVAEFGIEAASHTGDYYSYTGLASDSRELTIRAKAGAPRTGFVLLEGDDRTELASYPTHARQLVGERIALTALLTAVVADDTVVLGEAAGRVARAELNVTAPDGRRATYPMFDDGRHGDGAARDGVYGGEFAAAAAGKYLAQVVVHGRNRAGGPIVRTTEHVLPIVERSLAIAGPARGAAHDGTRLTIAIPVDVTAKAAGGTHYRAYAEVWGRDAHGRATPVAWVGGMVDANRGALALGFDERWVVRAGARAPFELRNLRVEDPDHFVTVAGADSLALELPDVRTKAAPASIAIDEAMTMGVRPAGLEAEKGVGSRLLLVHGYCSGGVWPTSHFTSASTFLDAYQNRTHDQFARLIQSFGNTWNSYGIVAHSQGGAAALHLYTYYWSGLDKAVGNRLIQSVGTPYKGTNLAGILATLGSWFGVGCGTNDNLSYSGASAWLAGIPTWARAKVNYYTTSFRLTNWYTNDYCNFATDLVLSDPEDGTTEQVNGQLSGGVNRGHTTGQCHTTGMRDPAQYNDYTRNSTMNANAAR